MCTSRRGRGRADQFRSPTRGKPVSARRRRLRSRPGHFRLRGLQPELPRLVRSSTPARHRSPRRRSRPKAASSSCCLRLHRPPLAFFSITRPQRREPRGGTPFRRRADRRTALARLDMDLTWQPLPGLSMLASYAHVDAYVIADQLYPPGNKVPGVPADSGRLWRTTNSNPRRCACCYAVILPSAGRGATRPSGQVCVVARRAIWRQASCALVLTSQHLTFDNSAPAWDPSPSFDTISVRQLRSAAVEGSSPVSPEMPCGPDRHEVPSGSALDDARAD